MNSFDIFDIKEYKNFEKIFKIQEQSPIFWSDEYDCWIITDYLYIKKYISNYEYFSVANSFFIGDLLLKERSNPLRRMDHPECVPERQSTMVLLQNKINNDWTQLGEEIIENSLMQHNQSLSLVNDVIYPYLININLHPLTLDFEDYSLLVKAIDMYSKSFKKEDNNNAYFEYINILRAIFKKNSISLNKLEKKLCSDLLYSGTSTIIGPVKEILLNINSAVDNNYINECLRHATKASFVLRTAKRSIVIDNLNIKENDAVVFHLGAGNFDKKRWGNNSLEFNTDRIYDKISMAFGSGPHRCTGYNYVLSQLNQFLKIIKNKNIIIDNIIYLNKFDLRMHDVEDVIFHIED